MSISKNILSFARRLQLSVPPIIQAPMAGGITTPQLVANVSNAEALGSFATGYVPVQQVSLSIKAIKQLTQRPFAVNLFVPNKPHYNTHDISIYHQAMNNLRRQYGLPIEEKLPEILAPEDDLSGMVEVLIAEKVPVVSFTFGKLPNDLFMKLKNNGVYLIGTATSIQEGKELEQIGVDAIVAQGYEAGGHRGSFFATSSKHSNIGSMVLLPALINNVKVPIIAAGGIMSGSGIVSAFALGASAVQIGTAFLTTLESGAHQNQKKALENASISEVDLTVMTKAYSGKEARGLHQTFIDKVDSEVSSIPPYPIPNTLSSPLRKLGTHKDIPDLMSVWCGQGLPLLRPNISACSLLDKMRQEFTQALGELSTLNEESKKKPRIM